MNPWKHIEYSKIFPDSDCISLQGKEIQEKTEITILILIQC